MKIFDGNFWILVALLAVLALVAFVRGGQPLVLEAVGGGTRQFLRFVLVLYVSFLLAGLLESLLPRTWVSQALGENAGWRGLVLASAVGVVTPAGPFVSMPLAAGMLRSGAAPASVVAFVAAWGLLAIHRLIAWEIPMLGLRFALTRWALSLVAPVLLGWLARLYFRGAA
ncbi:MAG: permease [Myxococcota bacterium]